MEDGFYWPDPEELLKNFNKQSELLEKFGIVENLRGS